MANYAFVFVGPSCLAIKDSLVDRPEGILEKFTHQACRKGCKPVIAHYDKWARGNAGTPAIDFVMKKMGVPQHAKAIPGTAEDVVKVVKGQCARKLGKKHLCQDPETLKTFADCLEGIPMPVLMGKIGELMPLVSEPMCKKEKAYLESPDLWEEVIPIYLNKYAAVCNKL